MRSLSRSDMQSALRICRRVSLAYVLGAAAVGCDGPLGSVVKPEPSSIPTGWTPARVRGHVADSGTPRVVQDAGQPTPEPKPVVDSGSPQPDAGPETPSVVPTASIVISPTPVTGAASELPASFSISGVSELYIYTAWNNLCGEHTELRKFYEPSGAVYYQKLTAFSTDISERIPFTRKVDVPHNKSVLPVIANAEGALVMEDYFILTGTWISDHSITGTWKLELYLDDEKTPTSTRSFELTP